MLTGSPSLDAKQHRDRRTQLTTEAPCRRHARDLVPQGANDVVAEEPEACAEEEARDDEEPDWCVGAGLDEAGVESLVDGGPRTDGVRDVVAAVRDGHKHGAGDLAVGPEVLDTRMS